MTALPQTWHLLTVAEYLALGEDEDCRRELQEGNVVMSPSPSMQHMSVSGELYRQVAAQLPSDLRVIPDVDIDLQLGVSGGGATVRRPDLVVVTRSEFDRVLKAGGILQAAGVRAIVEIVSPGSRRTDHVMKRHEYAEAGIATYWIIDPTTPVSLLALSLIDDSGYREQGEFTGSFETFQPCALKIDLDQLGR